MHFSTETICKIDVHVAIIWSELLKHVILSVWRAHSVCTSGVNVTAQAACSATSTERLLATVTVVIALTM